MNEQIQENGVAMETNNIKKPASSWAKAFCWISLIFSLTVPVAAIGLSIVNLSSLSVSEDKELKILSFVSIAISAYFLISDAITSLMGI